MASNRTLHKDALAHLRCYSPLTYGMSWPREVAKYAEAKGWIEWVPPQFGTTLYAITDAGRDALASEDKSDG